MRKWIPKGGRGRSKVKISSPEAPKAIEGSEWKVQQTLLGQHSRFWVRGVRGPGKLSLRAGSEMQTSCQMGPGEQGLERERQEKGSWATAEP